FGQEHGGIKVNLFNRNPTNSITIQYCDVIPWYLRLYMHTLKVTVNGNEISSGSSYPIKQLFYQPAVDRSRPSVMEANISLPADSITTLSIEFDKAFIKYTEHPPDANRGFDVGSAVITTLSKVESKWDSILYKQQSQDGIHYVPIRIYTETLLISLPTPDFSMPYNVITLTCTVIALFFGSMFNLLTRSFVVLDNEKPEEK
ncbi:667_t:CDS:2, partial [Paraglomus occultum]